MPRIQRKLIFALAGLVLVVVSLSGVLAERELRVRSMERIERSLIDRAQLTSELFASIPLHADSISQIDPLADRAGQAAQARVTVIGADGRVLGDSDVPAQDLVTVEPHGDRPEIKEALAGGIGQSSRRSQTVKRNLLYVAAPAGSGANPGVIRLAVDLDDVDAAVWELRRVLIFAALVGLVAAVGLSALLARITLRPIEELHDVVVGISEGQLDRRLHWWSRDELGEIGLAINRVAEQMRSRLDEATREKEQLEVVLSSMVEGVLVLDAEGRVSLANPRLRELLDLWGHIHNRPWFELIRDPRAESAIREAMDERRLVVCEFAEEDGEGRVLLLHVIGFPAEGPRAGTVAVFHDVTEMRRLDDVRRDFIANASHELKTPLTAISGFADTLLESDLSDEEKRSSVEIIARNAQRMTSLVEDLLTLSRIEGRKAKLETSEVDIHDLARVMLDDLAQRSKAESIETNLHTSGDPRARADKRAVEQVLANLLDNSLKYTGVGGKIDITIEAVDGNLRVSVADTGLGIPEEDQSRIFERFYRVDNARSRALGGTGLGLSIVKHLVHSMGGEVTVESQPGKGTSFTFTLPRSV